MTMHKNKIKTKSKTAVDSKTKTKSKSASSNKTRVKITKKKTSGKNVGEKKKINFNLLLVITFFTGVLLTISSYAWFSTTLDVKVKFFDLVVSSDSGLFISLDGINYSSSVEISRESLITELNSTYPDHTSQWASGGLSPVSSNGIRNSNSEKFDMYAGSTRIYRSLDRKRLLNTRLINEDKSDSQNVYIAFDIFLKNVSGSPFNDNLYFDEGTEVYFDDIPYDDAFDDTKGIINSMRFGIVKINSVSAKADIDTIRNLTCDNNCEMVIYEPNSTLHAIDSINRASECGVTLVDGVYNPTYAVIKEGRLLELANGQEGSGIELDTEHFALQETITDFDKPIFEIPNGVTKLRAYVWIEGQDMDSLETTSRGAPIYISINFIKDLEGYE